MKFLKLLIIVLSLSIPIHSYACWENDWDDDDSSWYDDWYDADDYDDWYDDDDYDISGGMLPEVDVYPDNWDNDDDWNNDDDWWRTPDDDDDWGNDNDDDVEWEYDLPEVIITPNHNTSNTNTSPNNNDVDKLKNAVKEAVQQTIKSNGSKIAACNIGVNNAFTNLYKSTELKDKKANQLVEYWKSSANWQQISITQAQQLANKGYFVVAGWKNPTGRSGHVVVIVPGKETYSPSWGQNVPRIMDTGPNRRSTDLPLSAGFAKGKKNEVLFFKYKK